MDQDPPRESPPSTFSPAGCLVAVGLVLLFFAVAFGFYFIVPRYQARWADLGGPPTASAGALVAVSTWFVRYWWSALGALIVGLAWWRPWRR